MGMYDSEPNFGETFGTNDRFILMGMKVVGEINTIHGPATKTILRIVCRNHPDKIVEYSALGVGIANQAQRAKSSDFPHVAQLVSIDIGNNKAVKRFAPIDISPRDFLDGDDGPAPDPKYLEAAASSAASGSGEASLGF